MRKFFAALPMIGLILGAVAIATEIKTTNPVPNGQQLSGAVVTCIKTALEKRENAVVSAVTTFQNSSLAALNTRKTSLLAAWDKTTKTDVKAAITVARKAYKTSMTDLKTTQSTARKWAWDIYKTDVKACKWIQLVQAVDTSSPNSEQ